jgi:hypothetical protein
MITLVAISPLTLGHNHLLSSSIIVLSDLLEVLVDEEVVEE